MNTLFSSLLDYQEGYGYAPISSILLCLLSAFLLAHAAAWVYLRTHRGVSYSGTMARSLIILSLIVALVMVVVGSNIARAFGLFGALALIRFRTPVKDANDTVFLFLSVAIGIATGTGNVLAGALATILICATILYLTAMRFGNPLGHDGLLRFRCPVGAGGDESIRRVLGRYCDAFDLLHIREADDGAAMEFSYQLTLSDTHESSHLMAEIEAFDEVSQLSLLMQDAEATP